MEKECKCPECRKRQEEIEQAEEIGMSFLIALMPLLTVTVFSNIGLF